MRQNIPSTSRQPGADSTRVGNFLRTLQIDHGPIDLLGKFFLKGEMAVRARGLDLHFGSFAELAEVNVANQHTWAPLLPFFRPDAHGLSSNNAFCILGRNATGDIVATQAARFFDLSNTNLFEEAQSLRLFYGAGEKPADASCHIDAQSAGISGYLVYSGGGWYRPDYRGIQLSAILPRISRAYALARWNTIATVSFVNVGLVQKGIVARYGYSKFAGNVRLQNVFAADFNGMVAHMEQNELLEDLRTFLSSFDAEVDALGQRGSRDKHALASGSGER
jgi:hypothetical protein